MQVAWARSDDWDHFGPLHAQSSRCGQFASSTCTSTTSRWEYMRIISSNHCKARFESYNIENMVLWTTTAALNCGSQSRRKTAPGAAEFRTKECVPDGNTTLSRTLCDIPAEIWRSKFKCFTCSVEIKLSKSKLGLLSQETHEILDAFTEPFFGTFTKVGQLWISNLSTRRIQTTSPAALARRSRVKTPHISAAAKSCGLGLGGYRSPVDTPRGSQDAITPTRDTIWEHHLWKVNCQATEPLPHFPDLVHFLEKTFSQTRKLGKR